MSAPRRPRIHVIAGVNGAGKSSIGGAIIRQRGGVYFNPDEAARQLLASGSALSQADANGAAWQMVVRMLTLAIEKRLDFTFETTLGGKTIAGLLTQAASQGFDVHVWYVGLSSPDLHIERVQSRVSHGGHDVPENAIRRRYEDSRLNLIKLLPQLTTLRVYDNSRDADPKAGKRPEPALVLHLDRGKINGPPDLSKTPQWAKPIVLAALKLKLS